MEAAGMKPKKIALMCGKMNGGGAERVAGMLSRRLESLYDVYVMLLDIKDITYDHGGNLIPIMPQNNTTPVLFFIFRCVRKSLVISARLFGTNNVETIFTKWQKRRHGIDCCISFLEHYNCTNLRSRGREKVIISVRNTLSAMIDIPLQEEYLGNVRGLYDQADLIVACSEGVRLDLTQNLGVPKEKCVTIHNFCDVERIRALAGKPLDAEMDRFFSGHRLIVTAGRLEPQKNQEKLLYDFALVYQAYPDVRLVVIGSGTWRERLGALATQLHIADVVLFLPYRENPFVVYTKASMFVLSSWHEGYPNVLLEAMACGLPTVSVDCPSGPREIIAGRSDYQNPINDYEICERGILVSASNDEMTGKTHYLADAMKCLLEDRMLSEKISREARQYTDTYPNDHILEQWIDAIEARQR